MLGIVCLAIMANSEMRATFSTRKLLSIICAGCLTFVSICFAMIMKARASNTPSLVRIMLVSLADVVTEILCITALSKDFVFSHIQVNINNLDDNILSIMHTILALMQTLVTLHIYRKFGSLDTSNAIRGVCLIINILLRAMSTKVWTLKSSSYTRIGLLLSLRFALPVLALVK